MKHSPRRATRPPQSTGWMAGRRAWSRVSTGAVLDADSIVRRTMRESRAAAAPRTVDRAVERQVLDGARVDRLRAKLNSGKHELAVRGARLLLELTEPESLAQAQRYAFLGHDASAGAGRALEEAWERYRHDRYRALN